VTSKHRTTTGTGGAVQLLKMSPMAQVLTAGPVKLPEVKAPSLDGLTVRVPKPDDLTSDDLIARLHEKARAFATVRERAAGEALAVGDEVVVDTVGYVDGKLIPFSARFGLQLELAPMLMLPGFAEAVAKGTVGASLQLQLTLPASYPVERLRGKPARFIVDVKSAREVKRPALDAPAFLAQLQLGKDLDEVMTKVREELEQEQADALWVEARDLVLDELASRANPSVPKSLVDDEIQRRWGDAEGRGLVDRKFDVAEQREALDGWLADPATRADAERRLRVSLALKAMTEAEQLALTPEKLEALLAADGAAFGVSADEVRQALRETTETTKRLTQLGWHLLAVDHAMSKAKVTFEGA
jgi:trigger factor